MSEVSLHHLLKTFVALYSQYRCIQHHLVDQFFCLDLINVSHLFTFQMPWKQSNWAFPTTALSLTVMEWISDNFQPLLTCKLLDFKARQQNCYALEECCGDIRRSMILGRRICGTCKILRLLGRFNETCIFVWNTIQVCVIIYSCNYQRLQYCAVYEFRIFVYHCWTSKMHLLFSIFFFTAVVLFVLSLCPHPVVLVVKVF